MVNFSIAKHTSIELIADSKFRTDINYLISKYKWRSELELENARIKRVFANQALENSILREVVSGNF